VKRGPTTPFTGKHDRISATRLRFAEAFIDADRRNLPDKPHVANGAWMLLIAEAHIPSFLPVSVETLAFNDPYEQVPEPGGQWSRRPTSGSTRPWRSPPPSARCSKGRTREERDPTPCT
jgi:hypothetical protein